VDTITEQSNSYRVLQPPAFVNQYAAMPSLHVGWDLCVGLALVAAAGTLTMRTIGRLMPVVMAAATVLTANHYLLDVIAGAAFGLAGWAIALQVEKRRDARRTPPLDLRAERQADLRADRRADEVRLPGLPEQREAGDAARLRCAEPS
jgi:membrane-associated phospholipid phosphatase